MAPDTTSPDNMSQDSMSPAPRQDVLLARLDELAESGPVSTEGRPGHWRAVPYGAEGFEGVMLACGEATHPAPVGLRLGVTGIYRIWLGLYAWDRGTVRVRLSRDRCCTEISAPPFGVIDPPNLHEVLWKTAELGDQSLWLEGAHAHQPLAGALAYIRLEPVEALPEEAPAPEVWRGMCLTNDGCGVFRGGPHHRPEDLLETLETVPDSSCMRSLVWGNGNADSCNYPTKVGNPMLLKRWQDFHVAADGVYGLPNVERWQQRGWDSLRLVRDYTRERGWELQVYIRMEAFAGSFPHEELVWSEFFYDHPEWWCRDREGKAVNRLSYAHREVQDHMLDLMAEIGRYGPEGLCMCLTRGIPVVLYEPAMVEQFERRHGVDPRQVDELDERWLALQAEVFTGFVRRARERLGPGLRLSAMVPGIGADCHRWGLDVPTWVKEGLVDDLYPVGQRFNRANTHYDDPEALEIGYFQGLDGRDRIRLIPCFYTWTLYRKDPVAFRRLVRSFLDQGADQYCIWDGDASYDDARVGDLGYRDWSGPAYAAAPGPEARTVALQSLNGFGVDQYGACEIV